MTESLKEISDISLLKLDQPFTRYPRDGSVYRINPICLPENNTFSRIFENRKYPENATYYGFGVINENSFFNRWADYLQKAEIVVEPSCPFLGDGYCAYHHGNVSRPCPLIFVL